MASRPSATAGTVLAALLLVVAGVWQVLTGFAAVVRGGYFTAPADYPFAFSVAAWGWVHLIVGAFAVVVGVGLFTGAVVWRVLGIALACCSLVSSFLWIPFEPWWSVLVIALDVLVVWSLLNAGDRSIRDRLADR
ncbi:hypothetical protein GCM10009830_10000 [Glycomyces endophyticus]|uniref:DUF7144 domain-containing protein n=1 Tax=Glycomyces endophyticus TaxID=480996 RepID=A0ABN2G6Y3_9ACTN